MAIKRGTGKTHDVNLCGCLMHSVLITRSVEEADAFHQEAGSARHQAEFQQETERPGVLMLADVSQMRKQSQEKACELQQHGETRPIFSHKALLSSPPDLA